MQEEASKEKRARYSDAVEEERYYVEETAWRYYGGRCNANVTPTVEPLPIAPPLNATTFPPRWRFDELSRVLFGDFTDHPRGPLEAEDLVFLLQMMERDDITVVTEGFASRLDPCLWTLGMLENIVGNVMCHQFRVFERSLSLHPSGNYYETFKEQGFCSNMTMNDYIRYLNQRNTQLQCIERRLKSLFNTSKFMLSSNQEAECRDGSEEAFTYNSFKDGKTHTINCIDIILYLIDYDFGKLLPVHYDDFSQQFMVPQLLPGSPFCLMNAVMIFLFYLLLPLFHLLFCVIL
jgi:hypothetical protein